MRQPLLSNKEREDILPDRHLSVSFLDTCEGIIGTGFAVRFRSFLHTEMYWHRVEAFRRAGEVALLTLPLWSSSPC